MSHGLLGDITMIQTLPRRNASNSTAVAPPPLAGMDVTPKRTANLRATGTPKSWQRPLNTLERTCYISPFSGLEEEREAENPNISWTASGAVEVINRSDSPAAVAAGMAIGDGVGEGKEDRVPWQPLYSKFDSSLLERRGIQSGLQMQARMLKNRARNQKGAPTSVPLAKSLVRSSPTANLIPANPQSPLRHGETDEADVVYVRHYGTTRNWVNEESGIFEGTAASSGTIKQQSTPWAKEFSSSAHLWRERGAHQRTDVPVNERYKKPLTESQIVGWDLSTAEWHDNQQFPKQRCHLTKAWHDLKIGNVDNTMMRRCKGMKC